MSVSCEIVFIRNPTKVFYLGQPLRGYVHLAVKNQQDVHGIHVKLSGVSVANWKIGRAIRRCTEDCLNYQTSIIGLFESKKILKVFWINDFSLTRFEITFKMNGYF